MTAALNETNGKPPAPVPGTASVSPRDVFPDPLTIEQLDDREAHAEDRIIIIGMVEGRLLSVACTMRGETIRIISARGAEPHEQRRYHEDNS
jgi:uncharacterized protein